jgi:hypothetical protein
MNYLLDKLDPKKRKELLEALNETIRPKKDFFEMLVKKVEPELKDIVIEPKKRGNVMTEQECFDEYMRLCDLQTKDNRFGSKGFDIGNDA